MSISSQPPKEPVARRNGGGTICLVQALQLASFPTSCFLENVCLPVSLGALKNEVHIHSSLGEESEPKLPCSCSPVPENQSFQLLANITSPEAGYFEGSRRVREKKVIDVTPTCAQQQKASR